jgi:hypothetical protein
MGWRNETMRGGFAGWGRPGYSRSCRCWGGPTATARMLSRDRSTIHRWITGERPIPAWAAERLEIRAQEAQISLAVAIVELKTRQREGKRRAEEGIAARRRAALGRARRGSSAAANAVPP